MILEDRITELYGLDVIGESQKLASLKYFNEAVACQKSGHDMSAAQNISLFLSAAGADELPAKELKMIAERTVEIVKVLATNDQNKIRVDSFKWDRGLWSGRNLKENNKVSKNNYRWSNPEVNIPLDGSSEKIDKNQYRWKKDCI